MEPTVCVKALRIVVATAASRGIAPPAALDAIGVTPEQLADPSARVPHSLAVRAWTALPALAREPALGLHAAELAAGSAFDVIDYVTAHCATIGAAVACLVRFQRLLHDANDVTLEVRGDEARITQRLRVPGPLPAALSDFIVAQWALRGRALTGAAARIRRVELARPAPADLAPYRAVFPAPMAFHAESNAMSFDAAYLATPLPRADHALAAVLGRHAEDLLAQLPPGSSAAAQLKRHLTATLAAEPPEVARAARALGLSTRSLQRRLEDEGTSFKSVLDEARRALALAQLRDPTRTISEVALVVGFSELSAFSRAFRRWTGRTPAEWRRGAARA